MSVNLELYNFFCSIVEYGSFSEASKKLYISQPAITQRIHNLEMQLNTKLFDRTAKGAKLTHEGKKLYQKVREPVKFLKEIELEEKNNITKNQKVIRIALIDTLFEIKFLYEIVMQFYQLYPNAKVRIEMINEKEETNNLLDADFILVSSPKKIRRKNIKIEDSIVLHPCFYTSVNYQKRNEKINLNHNNNNILILPKENTQERKMLNQIIKKNNIKMNHYYEADNPEMKNILLKKGLGITFGFKENIVDELQKRELIEIETNLEMKDYTIYIIEKEINKMNQIPNFSWKYLKAI